MTESTTGAHLHTVNAETRAGRLIAGGPNFNLPTRLGSFGRWLRRLAYRFQRHLDLHNREVFEALLEESGKQAQRESSAVALRLEAQITGLYQELSQIRRQTQGLDSIHHENRRHEAHLATLNLQIKKRLDAVEAKLGTLAAADGDNPPAQGQSESTVSPDIPSKDLSGEDLGVSFYDEAAKPLSEDEIRAAVAAHSPWYHRFELAPGIVTPGTHASQAALEDLDRLGLPTDCSNLRALDIGCRDGFFAFELERRGAEVVGIDYEPPEKTAFSLTARIKQSRVRFLTDNVYNLAPETHGRFDIILFLGVLYHLRNPVLAIDRIRSVASEGALLFTETQVAIDPTILGSTSPAWQFFPRDSLNGDSTNMWAPNEIALRRVLEECEFSVLQTSTGPLRGYAVAAAASDADLGYFRGLDSAGAESRSAHR